MSVTSAEWYRRAAGSLTSATQWTPRGMGFASALTPTCPRQRTLVDALMRGFGAGRTQACAVMRILRAAHRYPLRARDSRPLLLVVKETAHAIRLDRLSALVLFGLITLISCSREVAPLQALIGKWQVECAIVEIREGRRQRARFSEGDIYVSPGKKGIHVPLAACPGGGDSVLLLYHDRNDVYRLLHLGSGSLKDRLNIPGTGEGIALRYSEIEGFVAKDATRGILFRAKGAGAYEILLSKVGTSGEITVATVEMRLLQK